MNRPWIAEKIVTPQLARRLVNLQFPELEILSLQKFGEGWDNTVYLINHRYVFRFPRRQIAVTLLENEVRLLPEIQSKVSLKIPVPIFIGKPSSAFNWPFVGYEVLSGKTADSACLTDRDRIKNLKNLATFLRELHSFPLAEFIQPWEPHDELQRLNISIRGPQTLERLAKLENTYGLKYLNPFKKCIKNFPIKKYEEKQNLVHGDLYAKHMIVDDNLNLTGIIDWGDSHFGNRAVDLSIVYTFVPTSFQDEFFNHYAEVEEEILQLAFFRAIYSSATILVYALDVKDLALAKEAKYSFYNLLANPILK